jgi:hypothetical protein
MMYGGGVSLVLGVGFRAGREAGGIQYLPIYSRKIKQTARGGVINNIGSAACYLFQGG